MWGIHYTFDTPILLGATIYSKTVSDFDLFVSLFFVICFFVLFLPHPQFYFITLSNKTVFTWSGSYKNSGLNVPMTSCDLLRPELLGGLRSFWIYPETSLSRWEGTAGNRQVLAFLLCFRYLHLWQSHSLSPLFFLVPCVRYQSSGIKDIYFLFSVLFLRTCVAHTMTGTYRNQGLDMPIAVCGPFPWGPARLNWPRLQTTAK